LWISIQFYKLQNFNLQNYFHSIWVIIDEFKNGCCYRIFTTGFWDTNHRKILSCQINAYKKILKTVVLLPIVTEVMAKKLTENYNQEQNEFMFRQKHTLETIWYRNYIQEKVYYSLDWRWKCHPKLFRKDKI